MTEKEFRKLKALDLIQMLLDQGNEATALKEELERKDAWLEVLSGESDVIKAKLNDRDAMTELIKQKLNESDERIRGLEKEVKGLYSDRIIELEEAGSLVQAALELNKIFEAAQKEAELYIYNKERRIKGERYATLSMSENATDNIIDHNAGNMTGNRPVNITEDIAGSLRSPDRPEPEVKEQPTYRSAYMAGLHAGEKTRYTSEPLEPVNEEQPAEEPIESVKEELSAEEAAEQYIEEQHIKEQYSEEQASPEARPKEEEVPPGLEAFQWRSADGQSQKPEGFDGPKRAEVSEQPQEDPMEQVIPPWLENPLWQDSDQLQSTVSSDEKPKTEEAKSEELQPEQPPEPKQKSKGLFGFFRRKS